MDPQSSPIPKKTVVFDENVQKIDDIEHQGLRISTKEYASEHSPPPSRQRLQKGVWGGFTRQMSTASVGRRRAWYARGIAVVLLLLMFIILGYL